LTLKVGNLEVRRDLLDVQDGVKGMVAVMEKGKSGEVYNICSGKTYDFQFIVDTLCSLSSKTVSVVQSESLLRPVDIEVLAGSHEKLSARTGWQPERDIQESLKDCLEEHRALRN
jgi:GDP-4-dehydro-6-deoxy-D-mannose reductase